MHFHADALVDADQAQHEAGGLVRGVHGAQVVVDDRAAVDGLGRLREVRRPPLCLGLGDIDGDCERA